jgi:hypothetical protein
LSLPIIWYWHLFSVLDTSFSRSGVNQMWILKSSKDLLETSISRSQYVCNSIKTFNFSTLYTIIHRYDADNHRIENSSVIEYHLYFSETLEGCLPHNRRVAEHNSYQWEPIVYWNTRRPNRTNMLSISVCM